MRLWCSSALCVVWLLLLTLSAKGQVTTGAILGVVRDLSGATVADTRVEVRRLETNTTSRIEAIFKDVSASSHFPSARTS